MDYVNLGREYTNNFQMDMDSLLRLYLRDVITKEMLNEGRKRLLDRIQRFVEEV